MLTLFQINFIHMRNVVLFVGMQTVNHIQMKRKFHFNVRSEQ